jgi:hypothetical protein
MIGIRVSYGGVVNIGNFENVKIDFEVSESLSVSSLDEALDVMLDYKLNLRRIFEEEKKRVLTVE